MYRNMNPADQSITGRSSKDISVVISLLNEKESLPELVSWIRKVMKDNGFSYEIIMVDDGSSDGSWEIIKELASAGHGLTSAGHEKVQTERDKVQGENDKAQDKAQTGNEAQRENEAQAGRDIRGISFRRNYGKSAALYWGFKAAEGNVVITMDADLQDSPDEIPAMYKMVTEETRWSRKKDTTSYPDGNSTEKTTSSQRIFLQKYTMLPHDGLQASACMT